MLTCARQLCFVIALLMCMSSRLLSQDGGHLVIVGGGLRIENKVVFDEFIRLCGGANEARIVVLPTASISDRDSHLMCDELAHYGVAREHLQVLDVTERNAQVSTSDEKILSQVRQATGVFLSGGDQRRLTRVLRHRDGTDTPLLGEIRALLKRGGVVGGSSAGASGQSERMLAVSGLPDQLLDEGLDALDFGITADPARRGLLLTQGLGFFHYGIIDQHFGQFRGRLGRLTRATLHSGLPFGFGIDENTALVVSPDGMMRVLGPNLVTVVMPAGAKEKDGPLGYSVSGVRLCVLSNGDSWNAKTGEFKINKQKKEIAHGAGEYRGNFVLPDIAAGGAMQLALLSGLAENTCASQDGLAMKYYPDHTHGYRFRLSKCQTSESHTGYYDNQWNYSLLDIDLTITPIVDGLKSPVARLPKDIAQLPERDALSAVWFRGIIPADDENHFRPRDTMTRLEFARALARSVHLPAPYPAAPDIADIATEFDGYDEVARVVANGWMELDSQKHFSSSTPVARATVCKALEQLYTHNHCNDEGLLLAIRSIGQQPAKPITRGEIARMLYVALDLP